jgi:hypothetical protein
VKRSGIDEAIWVVTHICIVITQGISLYSYLYLKQAKTYYLLCFLFNKIGEQEGGTGSSWRGWGDEGGVGPNTVCTCKYM